MKVFISMPMHGREIVDISRDLSVIREKIRKKWGDEIEAIIDTTDTKEPEQDLLYYIHPRLYYLGEAIKKMADCDTVVFANGWQYARGCRIEHEVTRLYPFDVFYEGKDIIV